MFIRQMRQQYLLLHNQRDGQGNHEQVRLGQFSGLQQLKEALLSEEWRRQFHSQYPKLRINWAKLIRAAQKLADLPSPQRLEQDPNRARRLRAEVEAARAALPARRNRFTPGDPLADRYLEALQELIQHLRAQAELEEAAEVAQKWVRSSGSAEALLEYGGLLQSLGRYQEAQAQFGKVHRRDHRRHYHLGALAWQMGQPEQALDHLLQGMLLWRAVARALVYRDQGLEAPDCGDYWENYGHLWSGEARGFLLAIASQSVIRLGIREAFEENIPLSRLLPGRVRGKVLARVLNRPGTFPPQRQPELTAT